jgi:hypothetical protein
MLALGLAKGDGRVHVLVHVQCLCRFMVKEQDEKYTGTALAARQSQPKFECRQYSGPNSSMVNNGPP